MLLPLLPLLLAGRAWGVWPPPPDAQTPLRVAKCCGAGQRLDASLARCERAPAAAAWLPGWLRARAAPPVLGLPEAVGAAPPLRAALDPSHDAVRRLLGADAPPLRLDLRPFGGRVRADAARAQLLCLDATGDAARPLVALTAVRLRALPKCCARGQSVDARLASCVPPLAPGARGPREEVLDPAADAAALTWLPLRLQRSVVRVRYEALARARWLVHTDADDELRWRVMPDAGDNATAWVCDMGSANPLGFRPEGATAAFCLDATEAGAQPRHVLLSEFAQLRKCCAKGEQLDARASRCEARPGFEAQADAPPELLDPARADAYWLPLSLRGSRLPVAYGAAFSQPPRAFPAEGGARWFIEFSHRAGANVLSLERAAPSGAAVRLRMAEFCADAVAGDGPLAPRALLAVPPDLAALLGTKCCAATQRLSPAGRCEEAPPPPPPPDGEDAEGAAVRYGVPNAFCGPGAAFRVHPPAGEDLLDRVAHSVRDDTFHTEYFCADAQRQADGTTRQVLASCVAPPSAPLYEAVRPLHVAAAALLAAALAALLRRPRTRASTHGRALACHAACLLAANALQAAWFFTHRRGADCALFAYAVYLALVGAAFWLNVISLNMALGFRQPQAALQRARAGLVGGRRGGRFARWALYAWGGAGALTALAVAAHHWADAVRERGLAPPTFMETRTCYVEFVYSSAGDDTIGRARHSAAELGALYFYYTPVAALAAANAGCVLFAAMRIRALRRESSSLGPQRSALNAALLYVKLLLTAGALEVAAEGAAWSARQRRFRGRLMLARDHAAHIAYVFAVAATFLDVARAAAVLWLCVGRCAPSAAPVAPARTTAPGRTATTAVSSGRDVTTHL